MRKFLIPLLLLVAIAVMAAVVPWNNQNLIKFVPRVECMEDLLFHTTITGNEGAIISNPHADSLVFNEAHGVFRGDILVTGNDVRFGAGAMMSNAGDTLYFQDASENLGFLFSSNLVSCKSTTGVTKVDFGTLDLATDVFTATTQVTIGGGAGVITDAAGTMTITEDTVALSGKLKLGNVVESFTESGDSVCAIVVGGTTYKIRP